MTEDWHDPHWRACAEDAAIERGEHAAWLAEFSRRMGLGHR